MSGLRVHQAGPACTVQDPGRPGFLGQGLSRGGAADPLALVEGAALLGQDAGLAALEIAGFGGVFEAEGDLRIALTGAPMAAEIDGARVAWNASHALIAGQRLSLGAVRAGCYGYLHLGGGIDTPRVLGARAVHLAAGLGRAVAAGDQLPAGRDRGGETGLALEVADRFSGGALRVVEGVQTPLFSPEVRARFEATEFVRGGRANRMGVALDCPGEGFAAEGQLAILSEVIVPGDIQMTGDGRPFVLLPECQTTGGYPRIGTVIPCDLPKVAQAPAGAPLRFCFVSRAVALEAEARHASHLAGLRRAPRPLVRHPGDIPDLLGYQLISGAVSAHHEPQGDSE